LVRPHLLSIDYGTPLQASKSGTTEPVPEKCRQNKGSASKIAGFTLITPLFGGTTGYLLT
jgi:hypothetical protein